MKRNKTLRIRNKKRAILFLMIVFMFTTGLQIVKVPGNKMEQWIWYEVKKGDTLWSISEEYNGGKRDHRQAIFNIQERNDLETATIYPGQQILVPVKGN